MDLNSFSSPFFPTEEMFADTTIVEMMSFQEGDHNDFLDAEAQYYKKKLEEDRKKQFPILTRQIESEFDNISVAGQENFSLETDIILEDEDEVQQNFFGESDLAVVQKPEVIIPYYKSVEKCSVGCQTIKSALQEESETEEFVKPKRQYNRKAKKAEKVKLKPEKVNKKGRRKRSRKNKENDQKDCCVLGCTNSVTNRLRFSLRMLKPEDFKPSYISRGYDNVCHYHYFSDLYKYKKSTKGKAEIQAKQEAKLKKERQ